MITFLVLLGGLFTLALGVAMLGLLIKLVLLPVRFALLLLKLVVAGAAGVVLLLVGLPLVAALLLPLVLAGLVVWGTARIVFA